MSTLTAHERSAYVRRKDSGFSRALVLPIAGDRTARQFDYSFSEKHH